jgi:hypothetical protein
MQNNGFTAPNGSTLEVATVSSDTKLILIQNNDASSDLRFGFTDAKTNATDGFLVEAKQTFPLPVDGNGGKIFVFGVGAIVAGVIGQL